jgi:hemin uptake protein HemP
MTRILADLPDEKVRVESRDMFGEYDDHQGQIYLDMAARKYPKLIVNEASYT